MPSGRVSKRPCVSRLAVDVEEAVVEEPVLLEEVVAVKELVLLSVLSISEMWP